MHQTHIANSPQQLRSAGEPPLGPRLGIIGGGQLARMLAKAAQQLGIEVVVLEKSTPCPAAALATEFLVGDWNTLAPLLELAQRVDVVTIESEFVPAERLAELTDRGVTVLPSASSLGLVQDKYLQKHRLESAGLPGPRTRAVANLAELRDATRELGLPCLLKARRNAYDGKGNVTMRSPTDIEPAWLRLSNTAGNQLFAEEFCDFAAELATIITRSRSGETVVYPVVESVQRNHVCAIVRAPARVSDAVAARAVEVAQRAVEAVGAVGSYGVEMFLTRRNEILLNELAPRVHNSGHYTIEACVCSQFENHVRAVLGLPLGSAQMVAPAAVMVNLLGERTAPARVHGLDRALAVPGAHVHLYGKTMSGPGRKLGHVTAIGSTLEEAESAAASSAAHLRFGTGPVE